MGEKEVKIKETIPLPIAISIVVVFSLLIPILSGIINFPLWACFIVWAEYFALGAKPEGIKYIIPAYSVGALLTWVSAVMWTALMAAGIEMWTSIGLSLFIWMVPVGYLATHIPLFMKGSLPLFNGVSMYLAIYFTASVPSLFLPDPFLLCHGALLITVITSLIGSFFGWINVVITFPKEVKE
ncbi:MAG: DUF1097 family protein [Candidatus Njordarchaeia archaeon]